jgi:hypothetical protein
MPKSSITLPEIQLLYLRQLFDEKESNGHDSNEISLDFNNMFNTSYGKSYLYDQNLKFKTNNSMKRELSFDSINLNELPSN